MFIVAGNSKQTNLIPSSESSKELGIFCRDHFGKRPRFQQKKYPQQIPGESPRPSSSLRMPLSNSILLSLPNLPLPPFLLLLERSATPLRPVSPERSQRKVGKKERSKCNKSYSKYIFAIIMFRA